MADEIAYKKVTQKADYCSAEESAQRGRKPYQKLKPYIVQQILLKETDEDHVLTAEDIVARLEEMGIDAERRSIYRDINAINQIALMIEEGCTAEEAEFMLAEDEDDELKLIVYDRHRKKRGFYAKRRQYDLIDIRLLAECVYSAKFMPEGQAKRLVDVVCDFVSEHQAYKIKHNAFLTDRIKTNNRSVLNNISTINEAMSRQKDGKPHKPEKISFKYLKHSIDDLEKQTERRHGLKYVVSPYQLLINDGYYYLLAFDDKKKEMVTYRVDRMKDVERHGEVREGEAAFKEIDLKTYTQRVFFMYGGEQKYVTLRFINPLLDAVIDRFGTKNAQYAKVDDKHFRVTVKVELSDQFFGWLLGFGKKVKLLSPDDVIDKFVAYLDKVREMY